LASLSLFKVPGAILAHARTLIVGGDGSAAPPRAEDPPCASKPDPGAEWDVMTQDKTFWAMLAGADRGLCVLRRGIDEAAAETMAREPGAASSPGENAHLGESRFEAAKRKIADALKAEKS
jgi:hypothetical protein